jgi:hypothetical protein
MTFPVYVEQVCHGIVSQSTDPLAGGERSGGFDQCTNAERQDRDQLRKEWLSPGKIDAGECK